MKPLLHSGTQNQLDQFLKNPAHAVALIGEQGAGKGYIAHNIALSLLGSNAINHPYVLHLNAVQTKVGIEEIRNIQSFLSLRVPGDSDIKRVVILESINQYGHEAQNALLKTLEEPPLDTVIIVTIARSNAVLPTIHSRVQSVSINTVDLEQAISYYKSNYSVTEITKAHYISGGSVGLLYALLSNSSEHPLVQAITQARTLVGLTRYQRLAQVDAITKDKNTQPVLLLDGLHRLIDARYRQSLQTKTNDQLVSIVTRLKLIERAMQELQDNIQAKLVLSRLFLEF